MPRTVSFEGQTHQFPDDATDAEIASALGPQAKPTPPDTRGVVSGAIADTLGLSGRPGAVPLTGAPGTTTPAGVLLNPQTPLEHLARFAVAAPAIGLAGAGAGAAVPAALSPAAAIAARIAASGALGAGTAAAKGESVTRGAAMDAALAALTEGAAGMIPRLGWRRYSLQGAAEPVQTRREMPAKAAEQLVTKANLSPGRYLNIPALAPGKLTIREAASLLSQKSGMDYDQALVALMKELARTPAARKAGAAQLWSRWVPRQVPDSRMRELAYWLTRGARPGEVAPIRAALEGAGTAPVGEPSVPVGIPAAILGAQAGYNRLPAWMRP